MNFVKSKYLALFVAFIFVAISILVVSFSLIPEDLSDNDLHMPLHNNSSVKNQVTPRLTWQGENEEKKNGAGEVISSNDRVEKQVDQEGQRAPEDQVGLERKYYANQIDIQKASSENFPVDHIIKNGEEWIMAGVEDYQVLMYLEPFLESTDIRGVQETLQKLNLYNGVIDGLYGPKTLAAVQEFQKMYGLQPTGVVDLDDYSVLARAYEESIPVTIRSKPTGKITLLVILDERALYVLEDGQIFYKFPVSIGKRETPSPLGSWKIISKDSWSGAFGTRWMGLNVPYGRYGIHGTNKPWSIGGAMSHGCFRMYNRDVEILYDWVTWGTRVYVSGGEFPYNLPWRELKQGDRGSDVWIIQNRLKELGYYKWNPDGVYGWGTRNAVSKFQKDQGLEADGEISWNTLYKLDLYLFQ